MMIQHSKKPCVYTFYDLKVIFQSVFVLILKHLFREMLIDYYFLILDKNLPLPVFVMFEYSTLK